jgi:hypothetical protein
MELILCFDTINAKTKSKHMLQHIRDVFEIWNDLYKTGPCIIIDEQLTEFKDTAYFTYIYLHYQENLE